MSTISTGTTLTTGYVVTSDTTGALVVKTGSGNTTALTVDTNQNTTFNSTGAITLPVGTTAQRPSSLANGMMRVNTTTNAVEFYSASTGIWITSVSLNVVTSVEYLVIAGGGAGAQGGGGGAGGGGAGGYRCSVSGEASGGGAIAESPLSNLSPGVTYSVIVGAGGTMNSGFAGNVGGNSQFSTIISIGGGGGGSQSAPSSGGSGGGGGEVVGTYLGAAGTVYQGFAGGNGFYSGGNGGGGGGGAGAVGVTTVPGTTGAGGAGVASSITGTSVYRGGGGGAVTYNGTQSVGGIGGGGNGGATSGTANTGGGGGGSYPASNASGGSGVVIIRYPSTFPAATTTTGSPTITITGGYRIYQWNASGSITF